MVLASPVLSHSPLSSWSRRSTASASRTGMSWPAAQEKVLHLIRHGQTEMNVYLGHSPYGSPGFHDPLIYDTALTRQGVEQAKAAAKHSKHLRPLPELIIASPLSRALHTADLCLPQSSYPDVPRLAHPLARERLYLSSDVGLPKSELSGVWKHWSMEEFGQEPWWYRPDPDADMKAVTLEPEDLFLDRVEEFRVYLLGRPEGSIAVVSHSGVLEALTGYSFGNGEVRSFKGSELAARRS